MQELNEEEKGINFHEFEQFTQLLNNLEDFAIAVRLYSISGKGLNRDEFKRAAKICLHGQDLPDHVVNAVFKLFDRRGNPVKILKSHYFNVVKKFRETAIPRIFFL